MFQKYVFFQFVFDLMVCGRMNNNKCIEEFILLSPAPVDIAAKLARNFQLQVKYMYTIQYENNENVIGTVV